MPIPTQSSTSTVAEAPRPACDQWDGRSPGSRVIAACRLPELSLADRHQWHRASARRLQLRGQPWDCIAAPVRKIRTTFPHRSFIRKRPSSSLVQRRARALSMATPAGSDGVGGHTASIVAAGAMHYPGAVVRCSSKPWWLASETGSRCEWCITSQSRHCPRNGKRIKANT
jgi:hypothetical protein